MSETSCPICKTDSYLNPEMVLYVSPCFHKMCESCLKRHFANGTNKCPECGIELRKINYMSSTFEDIEVEKECRIRRQLDKHFRREEEDFEDPIRYNDYLEEIEKTVFGLLEYKSESLIKSKITDILNDETSILNIRNAVEPKEIEKEKLVVKEILEVGDDIKPLITKFPDHINLPNDYLLPSLSGGVSKDFILSYYMYLLRK
ncbi:hypothetical protein P3W45_000059 [Vairimorpha bombi]|jgi:CDK-activating kinase assembly factor MAT1